MYDLIIIGSGPAGLAAAIYAQRARLHFLVLEREPMSGGQIINTDAVDNYPGLPGINGFDLAMKLREHAESLGASFVCDEVVRIENMAGDIKTVCGQEGKYRTRTLILATGAAHRKLGVPGEETLAGRGVSYCAVCDGAFFRDQVTAVVGGGDVAVEDAIFLSRICRKVYLIHRRDELRAAASLQEQVRERENVEILWNTVVTEICGKEAVEELRLSRTVRDAGLQAAACGPAHQEDALKVDGVFAAVGIVPNSQIFAEVALDENGYVVADETGRTSCPGVFVAGDVRTKPLRQIVTAASDGANAVASAERFLAAHGAGNGRRNL
ncbi:MAG: thioredoxin-disulfide reductase [Lachnospiraceae bacterium]|nr:thioredoxin-disulfide reductase [Lachnospiraceae bacterium]